MNGQAVLFCVVVALVLQFIAIVIGIRCSRRDNYSHRPVPRVLVLVISSNSKQSAYSGDYERWTLEKRYWNDRISKYIILILTEISFRFALW